MDAALPWLLRVAWVLQPLTLGWLLGDALADADPTFATTTSVGLWVIWAFIVLATFVPVPITLTAIRIVAPAALAAGIWAAADTADPLPSAVGLSVALLATVAAVHPATGDTFVDGASYGDEKRFLLRVPGPLWFGPLPLTWIVCVLGAGTGPLLLADRSLLAGAIVTAVGVPVAALAAVALHRLHRRWLVFVPAGFVLHDSMALREPVLFPKTTVRAFGAAPAGTTARDLTRSALGHALQADLGQAAEVTTIGDDAAGTESVDQVLFAPARPGAALTEARSRGLTRG